MDADIQAAATALDLDKIKAQDYRNALAQQAADRAAQLALLESHFAWARAEYAALPPEDDAVEFRRQMAVAIAAKYFTTSTSTVPATIEADAVNDAARFKAALNEALKVV